MGILAIHVPVSGKVLVPNWLADVEVWYGGKGNTKGGAGRIAALEDDACFALSSKPKWPRLPSPLSNHIAAEWWEKVWRRLGARK